MPFSSSWKQVILCHASLRCFILQPALVIELPSIDISLAIIVRWNRDGAGRQAVVLVSSLFHLGGVFKLLSVARIVDIREHWFPFVKFGQW
jgi:hypothetical protein